MMLSMDFLSALLSARRGGTSASATRKRRTRGMQPALDCLEGRQLLSHVIHHNLAGRNASLASHVSTGTTTTTTTTVLSTDQQTLRTDLQTIRTKSAVTVGELTTLHTDLQALRTAGLTADRTKLETFKTDLLNAVAAANTAGTPLTLTQLGTQFLTEFEGVYGTAATSTTANTTAVTNAFNAYGTIALATNVNTDDVTKITNDLTAINGGSTTSTTTNAGCGGRSSTAADLLLPGF